MPSVSCPVCEADVEVGDETVAGELLECAECSAELEVTAVDPIKLEEAPEVEEDWGE